MLTKLKPKAKLLIEVVSDESKIKLMEKKKEKEIKTENADKNK